MLYSVDYAYLQASSRVLEYPNIRAGSRDGARRLGQRRRAHSSGLSAITLAWQHGHAAAAPAHAGTANRTGVAAQAPTQPSFGSVGLHAYSTQSLTPSMRAAAGYRVLQLQLQLRPSNST